jgi:hypothetical protein
MVELPETRPSMTPPESPVCQLNETLGRASHTVSTHIDTDRDTVERDLMKLVLTIIELLHQLMERQALRRADEGDLSEDQEERMGLTLMLLEERITELRERYGLTAADLNLDLGPLGSLLPR